MNIDEFEKQLIDLLTAGSFDEAESAKIAVKPWLKGALATDIDSAFRVLKLLSDLAGDAESFDNFSSLLGELQSDGLITENQVQELICSSPANRWL